MDETDKQPVSEPSVSKSRAVSIRINPWWLSALLAVGLVVVIAVWRPWEASTSASDRTVAVSGEATLKAEPDEFVFYPQYEFKNANKAAGLADLTDKSDKVVAGLKKLGVADKDIKTNASGYQDYYFYDTTAQTHNYTLSVTVTVSSRGMAQKVQDYLTGTTPTGAVSPQSTFSTKKQKQLESQGREEATKDARAKAEQQAKNLGFKIGKVKSVDDSASKYGGVMPMLSKSSADVAATSEASLAVQPGENELTYTVDVVYYIK